MQMDERIKFDEEYVNEEDKTTTYYYTADVSLLNELFPDKYPEAQSMEISIEFPTEHPEANFASVMVSPTKDGSDYDWTDIELPYDEIEELLKKVQNLSLDSMISETKEDLERKNVGMKVARQNKEMDL